MAEVVRDRTLDGLKFFLVSLVFVGHAIEPSRYLNNDSGILYSIIYSFHMPLFVILSGFFSKNLRLSNLNRHTFSLLETYLVMTIIMGWLLGYGLRLVLYPSLSCWYILSLIWWRYMLYWLVVKRKCKTRQLILYSSIILLFSFLLPIKNGLGLLSLMRTCQYFFFFVIGYCMSEGFILKLRCNVLAKKCMWGITMVLLFLIVVYSSRELHVLEFHRDTMVGLMNQFDWTSPQTLSYKCLSMVVALVVSFTFLTINKFPGIFERLGRYTLSFFFLQGIIIHKLVLIIPDNMYIEMLSAGGVILLGGGN